MRHLYISSTMVLLAVAPLMAQNPGPPSGDGIQPVFVEGNPTCVDLGFDGGCKQDPPGGVLECEGETIAVEVDDLLLDWSSTGLVDAVLVKGGPGLNLYSYGGDDADTLLHAPVNPSSGKFYGLSHVDFCGVDGPPPPPLGACCFECEPESGEVDECEDEATEAWCDEEGGDWYAERTCAEIDCDDTCPPPPSLGSCCELDAAGNFTGECLEDVERVECSDHGPWTEGATCEDLDCGVPVPAVPRLAVYLLVLGALWSIGGGLWLRSRRAGEEGA